MGETGLAGSSASLPLVGRDRELGELEALLDAAGRKRGGLVLLVGEPGIGKTWLARSFAERASSAGALVVWGRCWEGGGAPAYWPWVQVLRSLLDRAGAPAFPALSGGGAAALAEVLPELRAVAGIRRAGVSLEPEQARFAFFEAVGTLVTAVAAEAAVVVMLEDLHAADSASLLLARYLATEVQEASVLLVGTHRDVGADLKPPVGPLLAELSRSGRRLQLRRFREEEVACFLERVAGLEATDNVVETLYEATGGNPFFLDQFARLAAGAGSGSVPRDGGLLVPDTVREAVRQRLGLLSSDARHVLAVAAAVGQAPPLGVLSRTCDLTLPTLLDALAEAADAGILVAPASIGGVHAFAHALLRETVYSDLAPSRRLALHLRIGEAMEDVFQADPEPHLAELGHHFAVAAPVGGAGKALSYLTRAGERCLRLVAYEEAASNLTLALELLESHRPEDAQGRAELLIRLGDAQWRGGDVDTARTTFERAAAAARVAGSPNQLARAALGRAIGGQLGVVGRVLVGLLEEALADENVDSALRARLLACLASERRNSGCHDRITLAEEAVAVARRVGDPATLAYASNARRRAAWGADTPEDRLATGTEVVSMAELAGDPEVALQGHMWCLIGHLERGELGQACSALDAYERTAQELGQPLYLFYAASRRAMLALLAGSYAEAEAHTLAAGKLAERSREPETKLVVGSHLRVELAAALGRRHELEAALPGVKTWAAQVPLGVFPLPSCYHAWLLAILGRTTEAANAFEHIRAQGMAYLQGSSDFAFLLSPLAELCDALNQPAVAQELLELGRRYGSRVPVAGGAIVCWGSAARALGVLASAANQWAEAESHFENALAANHRLGARPWVARTQQDYARMLLARGAPTDGARAAELMASARSLAPDHICMTGLPSEPTSTPSRAPRSTGPTGSTEARFACEGDYWVLSYAGQEARLRDAKGLRYLRHLLSHPGREFHVLDLVALERGDDQRAPVGDAGEVLDVAAKLAYRRRLEELNEDLEEARAFNDPERAARAQAEIDSLVDQLAGAVGLGGRSRVAGSTGERARVAVTKAIKGALARINEAHPALGRHLTNCVRTGSFCSYNPEAPVTFSH